MISICIPVYNTEVKTLIESLDKQALACNIPYEILLLDDASSDANTIENNQRLECFKNLKIFSNEQNIGLAKTRNKLGGLAQYPYLLFIDSDAEIVKDDYLQTYISQLKINAVYFGGCIYPESCPSKEFKLRWTFGKRREEGVGKYFSCFNFLIPKDIFIKHPFSSELSQYGYEDALFGITLKKNGIDIQFINNPLLHIGLDTADVYLNKVKMSIQNLTVIEPLLKKINGEKQIKLLKLYYHIDKLCLTSVTSTLFRKLEKTLESNLTGNSPSLTILNLYKLGYLCNLKSKK